MPRPIGVLRAKATSSRCYIISLRVKFTCEYRHLLVQFLCPIQVLRARDLAGVNCQDQSFSMGTWRWLSRNSNAVTLKVFQGHAFDEGNFTSHPYCVLLPGTQGRHLNFEIWKHKYINLYKYMYLNTCINLYVFRYVFKYVFKYMYLNMYYPKFVNLFSTVCAEAGRLFRKDKHRSRHHFSRLASRWALS